MDVREKLVELLANKLVWGVEYTAEPKRIENEEIADYLIAHGVTVQSEIDAKTFQLMRECEKLQEENKILVNAVNVLEEINSDLYKKLNGVTVQEWISVNDRLPEEHGWYLIVANGKVEAARREPFLMFDEIWNNDATGGYSIIPEKEVTHWMPLPEPPKGE